MNTPKDSTAEQTPASLHRDGSASFVTFNINDYVLVKLTDYGRQCLRKNYDELNASYDGRLPFKHSPPPEDKDGWSRWQAWSLMADLGKHISMGMNPPFETTIRVEVERLTKRSAMRPTERHELSATRWAHSLHRLVSRHGQITKKPNETGSNKSHNNVLTYSDNLRSYGCRKNPTIAPANPGSDRNTQTKV